MQKKLKGGTHALRKRCPVCRKVRKFFEPPGDVGGNRHDRFLKWRGVVEKLGFTCDDARPTWILSPFGYTCIFCVQRIIEKSQVQNEPKTN